MSEHLEDEKSIVERFREQKAQKEGSSEDFKPKTKQEQVGRLPVEKLTGSLEKSGTTPTEPEQPESSEESNANLNDEPRRRRKRRVRSPRTTYKYVICTPDFRKRFEDIAEDEDWEDWEVFEAAVVALEAKLKRRPKKP